MTEEWEPGVPLYESNSSYRQYLFNFREDSRTEACHCTDAASWPEPSQFHDLDYLEKIQRNAMAAVCRARAAAYMGGA